MTRPPALLRALAAALAAAAAPALALAQAVPTRPDTGAPAESAWPLGLIVLGVAVVFLAGWLVSRRGRGPHRRARGTV
jgi:hypothetical protein